MIIELVATTCGIVTVCRVIQIKHKLKNRVREETLESLSRAVRLRSRRIGLVTDRTVELCINVGSYLELSSSEVERMTRAATLRDIGLCSVPYRLLNTKRFVDWDQTDRDTYRCHLAITDDLLAHSSSFAPERELLRQSESIYWLRDGSIRPSLTALVLKAACEFALHEAIFGTESAEGRLIAQSGREFEPSVVRAFLEVLHSNRVRAIAQSVV